MTSQLTASGSTSTGPAPSDQVLQTDPTDGSIAFPELYNFPPMWSLQRVLSTRESQNKWWSKWILAWCEHHRYWRLTIIDSLPTPLFQNVSLRKRMDIAEVQALVDWMASPQGGGRAEWIDAREGDRGASAWIYWRRPEEWAELIEKWADDTAQKNTVLTLYELAHGDAAKAQEFYGMDPDLLQKALQVLVKRGKAQIFGSEDEQGVKIF